MKQLLKMVSDLISKFDDRGFTFTSEDECEDHLSYLEVLNHDIIVGDDTNRETWNVHLNNVKGPSDLRDLLVEVFGQPSETLSNGVTNWKPTPVLWIQHSGDSVEFTQYYTKN